MHLGQESNVLPSERILCRSEHPQRTQEEAETNKKKKKKKKKKKTKKKKKKKKIKNLFL